MMKRKCKITALVLTVAMILTGSVPGLAFAESSGTDYTAVLQPSVSEVLTGGGVTVDVLLQSETQTAAPAAAEITLSYDQEKLDYQGSTAGTIETVRVTEDAGTVTASYLSDDTAATEGWTLTDGSICVAHLAFQTKTAGDAEISVENAVTLSETSFEDQSIAVRGITVKVKDRPAPIYLDGIDGSDENNGDSENTAVKSFDRAKELLQRDGEIYVVGSVRILKGEEENWSLPESEYGNSQVCFRQTVNKGPSGQYRECIRVEGGTLTLEDLDIEGYDGAPGTLIQVSSGKIVIDNVSLRNNIPSRNSAGAINMQSSTPSIIYDVTVENCEKANRGSVRAQKNNLDLRGGSIDGTITFDTESSKAVITPESDIRMRKVYPYSFGYGGETYLNVNNDARRIQEVRIGDELLASEEDGSYRIPNASEDVYIKMKEQEASDLSVDKSPVYFYAGKDWRVVDGSLTEQILTVTNTGEQPITIQAEQEENGYFILGEPQESSLEAGASTTLTVKPDASRIGDLAAGSSVSSAITISGDDGSTVMVYAIFKLLNAFTVTVTCGDHGSLQLDPDRQPYDQYLLLEDGSAINLYYYYRNSYYPVKAGETVRLLINDTNTYGRGGLEIWYDCETGYQLGPSTIFSGTDQENVQKYDLVNAYMIDENDANQDLRIKVNFIKRTFRMTYILDENSAGASAGGRLEGPASVEYGDDAEILLIPDDGYHLSESGVNGAGVSVDIDEDGIGTLKLENITTDTEVAAIFEPDPSEVAFRKHSLLLSGQIGVNFYLELPVESGETAEEKYKDSYVEFTVSGKTQRCVFDPERMDRDHKYYGFICKVNSIQMAEEITAVYHYGDDQIAEHKTDPDDPDKVTAYSVEKYVDTFRKLESGFDEETQTLVYALADYGHYIQPFLSEVRGWTIGTDYKEMPGANVLTEADVNAAKEAVSNVGILRDSTGTGIDKVAFSMTLDTDTALNFYLTPSSGYDGEVTAYQDQDGSQKNIAEKKGDRWLVCVPGIPAHKLGDDYLVHVKTGSGEFDLRASAMSYVNLLFQSSYANDEDAKYAMTALYNYYNAAYAVANA